MDLLAVLRSKIDSLEEGGYSPGLRAVLLHIGTAFKHLYRGQNEGDETAFTDAIYRTNQAFEGSIKEAYRVLAGKDPEKVRPFDIETYLEKEEVFRPRVLSQFTNYRQEWRNPSTHDYKLDFDESESFLAIISVSAFSCLVLDQIAGHLAYMRANEQAEKKKVSIAENTASSDGGLLDRTVSMLAEFHRLRLEHQGGAVFSRVSEVQVLGALAGFFASAAPDLEVSSDHRIGPELTPDLVVSMGDSVVIIELKSRYSEDAMHLGVAQLELLMRARRVGSGILFFYPLGAEFGELEVVEYSLVMEGRIVVLRPKR